MPMLEGDDEIRDLLRTARTIAVVGLSEKPWRDSHDIARFLLGAGYTVIPVNPAVSEVLGQKSYPDLDSLPGPVDIVDVFRRPEAVPSIAEAAIRNKAKALWLQLGVVHPPAARRAADAGLRVVMDRCILVEHRRLV